MFVAAVSGCAGEPSAERAEVGPAWVPCQLSAADGAQRVAAECGRLDVPEDRASEEGRTLALRWARLPARSREPASDPVLFLGGAPGEAATEAYVPLASALDPLRARRDVLLLDRRGTGGSQALRCEGLDLSAPPATIARDVAACRASLSARADLRRYGTMDSVADLEALRAELGVERVNLVAVGYGTRLAQAYLRRHPERVRSLVLDAALPPDEALGVELAEDLRRALDAQLSRCEEDAACAAAFREPRASLAALGAALDAEPISLTVRDPRGGGAREVALGRAEASLALLSLLAGTETSALLPLLVDSAAREGDFAPLAAEALRAAEALAVSRSLGASLSVLCAEDLPYHPLASFAASSETRRATEEGEGLPASIVPSRLRAACEGWPVAPASPALREPLDADVPALLLSGELDPLAPPARAARALEGLQAGRHLVLPGQGHGSLGRGCVPRLVEGFLAAGSAESLDPTCLEDLTPAPFFLDYAGPAP